MPAQRKIFIHGKPIFVSSRMQEGLPMVPTKFMNMVILSNLAKAQRLYPLTIVAFTMMRNHFHMLCVVENPEDVSNFFGYFKQEMTHAINRFLGRRKRTLWCEEFDSPTVLDSESVLNVISYIYTQPQMGGLTETIDEYPGVTSWHMLNAESTLCPCELIPRSAIPKLRDPGRPWREDQVIQSQLNQGSLGTIHLNVSHFAWQECFQETLNVPVEELRQRILAKVRRSEEDLRVERAKKKDKVKGVNALYRSSMKEPYAPVKFENKSLCIASKLATMMSFSRWAKQSVNESVEVYALWQQGHRSIPYPPGLFSPRMPRLQNLHNPPISS